jgi:hypothetical protein
VDPLGAHITSYERGIDPYLHTPCCTTFSGLYNDARMNKILYYFFGEVAVARKMAVFKKI